MGNDAMEWLRRALPDRLGELLGGDPVSAVLDVARTRAPIEFGLRNAPDPSTVTPELRKRLELAEKAEKKLKARQTLTEGETSALHLLVHLVGRPALRVKNGDVPKIPKSWPELEKHRQVIKRTLPGVGRIDTPDRTAHGTGWFVARDLLMTNAHVVTSLCGLNPNSSQYAELTADALPEWNEKWAEDPAQQPAWDPGDSPSKEKEPAGRITRARLHPTLDMALLDVVGVEDSERRVLSISKKAPTEPEKLSYVSGYPAVKSAQDWGLDTNVVKFLFDKADSVVHKRVSPGAVTEIGSDDALHDASTLGGSSGSPILDLETHLVVGLHYSGTYGTTNHSVALWKLQEDPFLKERVSFA